MIFFLIFRITNGSSALGPVASDLAVPVLGGGSFLQVRALQDCVFSISFLDVQHGFLQTLFLFQGLFLCLCFLFFCLIIGKQAELLIGLFLLYALFPHQVNWPSL